MASITASLPSPPLLVHGKRTLSSTLQTLPLSPIKDRQNCVSVVVRATGESSESSAPLGIVKSVKNIWDDSEDRLALVGLGFAALVAIWTSAKLIPAIDKLPVVPSVLELIGILFSSGRAIPDHQEVSCQYLRPVNHALKCSQACTFRAFPDWHIVYLYGWQ
ncbi:hypothetical protein BDE02_03G045800 [Populus trichocarpa]|nr:hypothetical protein BDE02_03G045800 [Populus trichocarpa]